MKLLLNVMYEDGSTVEAGATTVDLVDFEDHFDLSMLALDFNEIGLRHLSWLAWNHLRHDGTTSLDYRDWLATVDRVTLGGGEDPVPLESEAPTSASPD